MHLENVTPERENEISTAPEEFYWNAIRLVQTEE